jgi:hypothetical protein
MSRLRLFGLCLSLLVLASPKLLHAQAEPDPEPPDEQPAARSAAPAPAPGETSTPRGDPFARLKPVVSRDKLAPLSSVRVRDKREAADRSRKGTISVSVSTSPKGASVYYGTKLLGTTPLSLSAQRGSTPFDVVIRRGGYMTLHTRLMRKVSRGYSFKLTPSKLR